MSCILPKDVLVLVPAFNEASSVGDVVRSIKNLGFAVVVVDDGSDDSTSEVAQHAGATVLRLPINLGVGGALQCGFRYARSSGFKAVVQCDADGQHSPGHINLLIEEMTASGADLVIGSRFLSPTNQLDPTIPRRVAMRLLSRIASRAAGKRLTDVTSGFRIIRQPLLDIFSTTFPATYLGDTFEAVVAAGRAGYQIQEVGVPMSHRRHGQSSASTVRASGLVFKAVVTSLVGTQLRLR
jgi:glycosyltransferase involved in cell wall biosynthesis